MTTMTLTDKTTGKTIEITMVEPVRSPVLSIIGLVGFVGIAFTLMFAAIVL